MMDESTLIVIQGLYGFRVETTKAILDISFSLSKQLSRQGLEANPWLLPLMQRVGSIVSQLLVSNWQQ